MSMSTAGVTGGPSSGVILTGAVQAAYSQEILHAAQPILRFAQFCEVKEELGRQPGNSINFLRYGDVLGSANLTEGTNMTPDNLNSSLITITVAEKGKALTCSELLLQTSFDDVMASMTRKLGEHYARSLDCHVRNALLGGTNVVRVNSRATRSVFTAGDTFNMDTVRRAVEQLATNKAPKFDGDYFICLLHPHQASYLRRDPDWIKVTQYGDPNRAFRGEIGRIEDVRFIETTNTTVVKSGTYTTPGAIFADGRLDPDLTTAVDYHATIDTYQAVMQGANSVGIAYAMPVEIRDNGVEDFGRKHSLAWYGIYGVGLIETAHSLIIESV